MQKRKNWQLFLILAVTILTIYNILPTIFFYSKPLKKPIDAKEATKVSLQIAKRVNSLEKSNINWIKSYCDLLSIKASDINFDQNNPEQIAVSFSKEADANKFKNNIQRAGALISFPPAQLSIDTFDRNSSKTILVQRKIPVHFNTKNLDNFFSFTEKKANNEIASLYSEVILDRSSQLALTIVGTSDTARLTTDILETKSLTVSEELILSLAHSLTDFVKVFGENSTITSRYFASFTQDDSENKFQNIQQLINKIGKLRSQLKMEKIELSQKENLDVMEKENNEEHIALIDQKEKLLLNTETLIKRHSMKFSKGENPWNIKTIQNKYVFDGKDQITSLPISQRNALINKMYINWNDDSILLELHPDVIQYQNKLSENDKNLYNQIIINEIASLTRKTNESIQGNQLGFSINLNSLSSSNSMLVLKLDALAKEEVSNLISNIKNQWNPTYSELTKENFPIVSWEEYKNLSKEQQSLCLIVYAPIQDLNNSLEGFNSGSIYVIPKGVNRLIQKFQKSTKSAKTKEFFKDLYKLQGLLARSEMNAYLGEQMNLKEFQKELVFEKSNYYRNIIQATRENFKIHGSKRFATLEFTDYEQRLLTLNKIETNIHEDLIKWKDEYHAAQVNIDLRAKYDVPAPTQNILMNNLKLSVKKYFRGDERKILHWGLDLSGGKTVQIELRDQNNQIVTNEEAIKQGINELYTRVNKMGVSDVNIRQVDTNIVLDFPGSQNLSAQDLIKASSMFFHVVNEKFSTNNRAIADSVQRFLQEVWNEAVVTNKKDAENINLIAWSHLYGDSLDSKVAKPRTEAAKTLYTNGLRLASPLTDSSSSVLDLDLSKIAILRGDNFTDWQGQTHPLMIVFNNYALEGTSLTNIRSSYDPSKGNFLSFEVKKGYTKSNNEKVSPQNDLYEWTSHFAKEKIAGTSLAAYSPGRGWKMAVILNDTVISAPGLESALKNTAMITGNFSQRESNKLVADLKAGSLTFTPRILSEKNVSPELGQKERTQGIVATIAALILIVVMMIGYYRFSGLVASIAVIFNLIIMWATLQNLQATLSLAGIAGIILTVGMAVDANVLVFERIREDFAISNNIGAAIRSGYKKAFSAIFDSNITTIIAALILLHFDAGPIKGFAITLIIGIVSSMFSALFMTRYFFMNWAKKPNHTRLNMCNWLKKPNFNFLKNAKYIMSCSLILIILGSYFLVTHKHSVLGMDFTGGYSINLEIEPKANENYKAIVENAFETAGISSQNIQVRELSPSNNLRLLFSTIMDKEGNPFYNMPLETNFSEVEYSYENNPRIKWIVDTLQKEGISLTDSSKKMLNQSWSSMSGQMSDAMRNNAIIGLTIALIAILIYITFRFEFKFAISAMACLIHDVFLSIAAIAILNSFGVPVQLDLHTIAALMTIIGYSLNDTIIIFDRIREESKYSQKKTFAEVINHSLNTTLSRTSITSITTLAVLLTLVILGGSTIFSFALVMTLGVVFGTLSSLFIASPLMLLFHKREEQKELSL